jgi:phage terminase small subunit
MLWHFFYKVVNMPRAHKQADVLTAKRKRVRRTINSLKKSITDTMPESEAHARRVYIQRLETQLKNTYVGRTRDAAMRDELYQRANEKADVLIRQTESVRGGKGRAKERARSFNIFRNEMRMASKGLPSALGDLGREKVKVFWRYTQNIWQKSNVPPNKRLETIMQAYDADTLSELFDTIMRRNEKALEYAKNMKMHTGELEDYTDVEGGSPIWLIAVTPDVVR